VWALASRLLSHCIPQIGRTLQSVQRVIPLSVIGKNDWARKRDAIGLAAAARRATDAQVLEDAERLIAAWNERQAKRMPMLFSPNDRCRGISASIAGAR
jgi:hypothetical protein